MPGNQKIIIQCLGVIAAFVNFLSPCFAATPSPTATSAYQYTGGEPGSPVGKEVGFSFASSGSNSPTPVLYVGGGVGLPGSTVPSIPAPCVTPGSSLLALPSCTQLFPTPSSSSSPDQILKKNIAQILSCFYQGYVIDVSASSSAAQSCSAVSLPGSVRNSQVVCNLADGEGSLSVSTGSPPTLSSTLNHQASAQSCVLSNPDPIPGEPQNSAAWDLWYLSSWLDSQILGVWVQTAKYQLAQVITQMTSSNHQIQIAPTSACQALAQDYTTLFAFYARISDSLSSSNGVAMPSPGTWSLADCTPLNIAPSGSNSNLNAALPVSALCYLGSAAQGLISLYEQVAQCEVTGRADVAMANFQAKISSLLTPVGTSLRSVASLSVSDGISFSQDRICQTMETDRCVGSFNIGGCAQPRLIGDAKGYALSQFSQYFYKNLSALVSSLQTAVLKASPAQQQNWPSLSDDYLSVGVNPP